MATTQNIQNVLTACCQWMGGLHALPSHLLWVVVVMSFEACDDEVTVPQTTQETAISFGGSEQEEEVATRAAAPLNHDFTVWGYKTVDNAPQLVFNGYAVTYSNGTAHTTESNTHNYEYVGETQTIKYWDFGASEYNFWGATGGSFNSDGTELTISGLTLTTTEPKGAALFSSLYHRSPITHDVVQLQFKLPYAKVSVMFYCSEAIDEQDKVEIGTSTFGPESSDPIVTAGTLKVTYPRSGASPEKYTTSIATNGAALAFDAVELTHTKGASSNNAALAVPKDGTDFYYVVPYEYPMPFVLTTSVDGDSKTATVPTDYMHWQPNTVYTYIFKITEAGKKIEFYDVKIDPWKYGGSQDEEDWKNW